MREVRKNEMSVETQSYLCIYRFRGATFIRNYLNSFYLSIQSFYLFFNK